jgi:hypothetical protein
MLLNPVAEVIMLAFETSDRPLKVLSLNLHAGYPRVNVIHFRDDLLLLFLKVVHPFLEVVTVRLIPLLLQVLQLLLDTT